MRGLLSLVPGLLNHRIFLRFGYLIVSITFVLSNSSAATFSADQTSITVSAAPLNTATTAQVNISTDSTTPVTFTVTPNPAPGSWLRVYADFTPPSVVSGNPTALYIVADASNYSSPTTLNGTVTVTPTNLQAPSIQISITFNIGTSGTGPGPTTGTLVPSQSSVTFNYPTGTSGTNSVQITVNAASGASTTSFNAAATTQSGGQWLVLVCQNSCSNQPVGSQLVLKVDPSVAAGLATGTYQGTVTLTNTASSTDVTTINVTLSVNGGTSTNTSTLVPSQNNVSFSYAPSACGTAAAQVTVNASTGNNTTAFSAAASTQSGGQWLILTCQNSCSSQPIGSQLVLSVNTSIAASLSTGVYQGTVLLTNTASSTDQTAINVTLSINTAISTGTSTSTLAAPTSLTFVYPTAPSGGFPFQTILINGSNPTVLQSSNGSFPCGTGLSYALSGNTVLVSVSGSGFQIGSTYSGSITVGSSLGTQTVPVALTTFSGLTLIASPGTITCQPGQGACANNAVLLQMSDNSGRPLIVTSPTPWITLNPAGCGTTTPASCTVSVNQNGLPSGLNTGIITATASGAVNSPLTIPVVVQVSGDLSLSNNSLTFTTGLSGQQSITVTAATATSFGVTYGVNTPTGGTWLSATASATATPATVTVSINPTGLSPGQYTGYVSLTAAGGTPQMVTVNLTVPASSGGNITVTSVDPVTSLSFVAQSGGSPPASQQVMISSASGSSSVTFSYTTSSSWLLVNNSQTGLSTTPASLSVSINPAKLPSGTLSGAIIITPTGGQVVTINVSVTLTTPVSVSALPASLTWSYTTGTPPPPAAQIQVSGNGGALTFTATATSAGNWLVVNPASGTTVAGGTVPLTVSLQNLNSLVSSTTPYTGTIVVAGAVGSTTVNVSLTVLPQLPTVSKVMNAASFNSGSISAGEIITIFGTTLGPDSGVPLTQNLIVNNQLPTTLSGVQVLVNGFAAPMLYASSTQISAIVPYEINSFASTQNVNLQVKYLGQASNGFSLTQTAAAPGIFTANSSGSGPGAILNADGSTNFWANPANKGDPVVLYVTGEGQTNPAGVSGSITSITPPYPKPLHAPVVTIGGQPAQVLFYAESPGLVAGVMQINVQIPAAAASGDLPVVVWFGNASSQLTANGTGAVTISVR